MRLHCAPQLLSRLTVVLTIVKRTCPALVTVMPRWRSPSFFSGLDSTGVCTC